MFQTVTLGCGTRATPVPDPVQTCPLAKRQFCQAERFRQPLAEQDHTLVPSLESTRKTLRAFAILAGSSLLSPLGADVSPYPKKLTR